MQVLISHGADVNVPDIDGNTPLINAAKAASIYKIAIDGDVLAWAEKKKKNNADLEEVAANIKLAQQWIGTLSNNQ